MSKVGRPRKYVSDRERRRACKDRVWQRNQQNAAKAYLLEDLLVSIREAARVGALPVELHDEQDLLLLALKFRVWAQSRSAPNVESDAPQFHNARTGTVKMTR
jgi:hypothetical protein